MAQLVKHKTIKQALEYVSNNPAWSSSNKMDCPAWEHVGRQLFEHANNPDSRVVGSIGRATRAQKIIMDRLTGTRRAGSHPAVRNENKLKFKDLTGGAITSGE